MPQLSGGMLGHKVARLKKKGSCSLYGSTIDSSAEHTSQELPTLPTTLWRFVVKSSSYGSTMPPRLPPRFQYTNTSAIRDTRPAPTAASHTRHSSHISLIAVWGRTFAVDSSPFCTNCQNQPPELASHRTVWTSLPAPSPYSAHRNTAETVHLYDPS